MCTIARIVEQTCWHVANMFWSKTPKRSSKDLNTQHEIQKWKSQFYHTQDQIQNLNQCFPHIRGNSQKWGNRFLQLYIFSGIENVGCKKNICLCSPMFFLSKETRYWLLQALGGTQYICMNADYKIYGNVWMRNTRILYIHVAGSRFPPRTVMISPSRIGS